MQKRVFLGLIFIPGKYVLSDVVESPFTRMISSLKYSGPQHLSHAMNKPVNLSLVNFCEIV